MALSKFTINAEPGEAHVTVDGQPVSPSRLNLEMEAHDRIPVLSLEFPANIDTSGMGFVQVVRPPTPGEVMLVAAEWLEALDPDAIRALVQDRTQTMRSDPIAAVIKVLAAAAREQAD